MTTLEVILIRCPSADIEYILSDKGNIPKYYLTFKYFPARLRANDGNITNTVVKSNLIRISVNFVSGVSGPEDVKTIHMPINPKATDENIKIRVAIFCIFLVYQLREKT